MALIRWSKNPELLERVVRLRAEGKQFRQIGAILSLTECNIFYVYHTKLARRLCRRLRIPYYQRRTNPFRQLPKFSEAMIEHFVRLHFEEQHKWSEVGRITGFGNGYGIRMQCYSKVGKEIRLRLGLYRTKNVRADLTRKKFGHLKAIRVVGHNNHKNVLWRCKCSCGAFSDVPAASLNGGFTKSCGASVHRARGKDAATFKHGGCTKKNKRTWNSYKAMERRCFRVVDESYKTYGGRGITVCSHWRGPNGFTNFLASMGRRPANKSLDRKNPNGHYSCGRCQECVAKGWPANCRWATSAVQSSNKQCHHPPLSEEQKARLLRSQDPFLNPYSDEPVF